MVETGAEELGVGMESRVSLTRPHGSDPRVDVLRRASQGEQDGPVRELQARRLAQRQGRESSGQAPEKHWGGEGP